MLQRQDSVLGWHVVRGGRLRKRLLRTNCDFALLDGASS